MTKETAQSKHEKKVEMASASAPKYGIYIDGGSVSALIDAIEGIGPLINGIIESDSEEKTKRLALSLIKDTVPHIGSCSISNVFVDMGR